MSIFISTGEISGDMYAAKLNRSLRRILPDEELWGMGGELAEGINCEWDNSPLHIMGLTKILKSMPALIRLRTQLARAVIKRQPKAVIVIDSPDFHIPLVAKIRSVGYKGPVVYVCPPTIWAWRRGRAKQLRRYCDLTLPLFDFEEKVLEEQHVKTFWCGHPLIDQFRDYAPELTSHVAAAERSEASQTLPRDPRRVAILPGSRRSEILALMPVLEESARRLRDMGFHPVFSVAPGLDAESRDRIMQNKIAPALDTVTGAALMQQSRFVIGASGTAAVEAMLLDKYMIVVYKGTALEWGIYKMVTNIPLISIPNILAGHEMYPELLQEDATSDNIIACADQYLNDAEYRRDIHQTIMRNKTRMGEAGAINKWAEKIAKMIDKRAL